MAGEKTGHPLPGSDEARRSEIPEGLERDKGFGEDGEDGAGAAQPGRRAVNPDGEPYRTDDLGPAPGAGSGDD
jgi:hypothetical protein